MATAYIIYPDVCLDALDKSQTSNSIYSRIFLDSLLVEKRRVSTLKSKEYRAFIPDFHWKSLLKIIIDLINKQDPMTGEAKVTKDDLNLLQTVLEAVDRDGMENYPYQDNLTPLLDLAKDKSDMYEVKLVCNNDIIRSKIKEFMNDNPHLGMYHVISAQEAHQELSFKSSSFN